MTSTPIASRSKKYAVTVQDTNKAGQCEGWAQELGGRINQFELNVVDFFANFVPSNVPCLFEDDPKDEDLFGGWKPTPGKEKE